MTPKTRTARDRIAAFLTERSGALTDTIACSGASRDATRLTASDLAAVLDALARYETTEDADRRAAQGVRTEWEAGRYRHGQCEGCGCCNASGCHRGPDSLCPTNSLGDSVCPCTED